MLTITRHRALLAVALIVVLALSLITLWSPANFTLKTPPPPALLPPQPQGNLTYEQEYAKFLKDTQTDPVASAKILAGAIDPQDIKKMVDEGLGIGKPVKLPAADLKRIKSVSTDTPASLEKFASAAANLQLEFEYKTHDRNMIVFSGDDVSQTDFDSLKADTDNLLAALYNLEVPRSALKYHQSILGSYTVFSHILSKFNPALATPADKWQTLYHGYLVINNYMLSARNEAVAMDAKYRELGVAGGDTSFLNLNEFFGVKTAHAFLPGPGPLPVYIIGPLPLPNATQIDIPRIISEALQNKLAAAFASFALAVLKEYAKKLESALLVTNIMYYRDALTAVRYTDDYIKKYLPDLPLGSPEAKLIKAFIPEIGCGKEITEAQRDLINAKVIEYLGFDPGEALDITDPDFYVKINRAGHLPSSGTGMEIMYRAVAEVTGNRARDTAQSELFVPQKKVPVGPSILGGSRLETKLSLDGVQAQLLAATNQTLQVGTPNAWNAGGLVWIANVISIIQYFLVLGSAIKEQDACIDVPQVVPITPVGSPNIGGGVNVDALLQCQQQVFGNIDTVQLPDPNAISACLDAALQGIVNAIPPPASLPNQDVGPAPLGQNTGGNPNPSGSAAPNPNANPSGPSPNPVGPVGVFNPPAPIPEGGSGLVLDHTCYAVGEVPRLAIRNAPPNQLIYWSLFSQPGGQPAYVNLNFEDAGGPQATDANGNWPSTTGTVPDQFALVPADIGGWTRRARIGGVIYVFSYTVRATRAEC